ncbi:MAG: prepilin-type cleavage/methylation domain-containing protein, partial [Chthoniobacteraceae bacterium]
PVAWTDMQSYIKKGTRLYTSGGTDILGNAFTLPTVDSAPKLSATTYTALSDVAPASFWSPYR